MRSRATVGAVLAATMVGLAFACGGSSQAAYEPFPEYENVEEVPVVASLDSDKPRVGPTPPRSAVRLAAHYLRISQESSNVRCHGIPGGLIACRVHIADSQTRIAARLTLTPEGNYRDRILRCETIRLIEGRLSEAPCFDFTVWIFNKWQAGPPQIPSARRPATARAERPPALEVSTTGAETWKSAGESPAMTAAPGTPRSLVLRHAFVDEGTELAAGQLHFFAAENRHAQ